MKTEIDLVPTLPTPSTWPPEPLGYVETVRLIARLMEAQGTLGVAGSMGHGDAPRCALGLVYRFETSCGVGASDLNFTSWEARTDAMVFHDDIVNGWPRDEQLGVFLGAMAAMEERS